MEKKIYLANFNQKREGMTILISHKLDFRGKKIMRQRKILYMVKESVHQKYVAVLNMYVPNNKLQKTMELKGEIGQSVIIGGD